MNKTTFNRLEALRYQYLEGNLSLDDYLEAVGRVMSYKELDGRDVISVMATAITKGD